MVNVEGRVSTGGHPMSAIGRTGVARLRRRVVAAGGTVVVVAALGLAHTFSAYASGVPSRPVDRNLSSYVQFAQNTLQFKGANGGGGIIHGNVGVNAHGG